MGRGYHLLSMIVGIAALIIVAATWLLLGFMVGNSIPWHGRLARETATGIAIGTAPVVVVFIALDGVQLYYSHWLVVSSWYTFTGALGWRFRIWMETKRRRRRWIRSQPAQPAPAMRLKRA